MAETGRRECRATIAAGRDLVSAGATAAKYTHHRDQLIIVFIRILRAALELCVGQTLGETIDAVGRWPKDALEQRTHGRWMTERGKVTIDLRRTGP